MLLFAEDWSVWREGRGARAGVRVTRLEAEASGCAVPSETSAGVAAEAAVDEAFGRTTSAGGAAAAVTGVGGAIAALAVFAPCGFWAAWTHKNTPMLSTRTAAASTRFGLSPRPARCRHGRASETP